MSSLIAPTSARMRLARNVRRVRLEKGWSQEELSVRAGFSQAYVSQIEKGRLNVPIDRIECLAEAFQIDLIELLIL